MATTPDRAQSALEYFKKQGTRYYIIHWLFELKELRGTRYTTDIEEYLETICECCSLDFFNRLRLSENASSTLHILVWDLEENEIQHLSLKYHEWGGQIYRGDGHYPLFFQYPSKNMDIKQYHVNQYLDAYQTMYMTTSEDNEATLEELIRNSQWGTDEFVREDIMQLYYNQTTTEWALAQPDECEANLKHPSAAVLVSS